MDGGGTSEAFLFLTTPATVQMNTVRRYRTRVYAKRFVVDDRFHDCGVYCSRNTDTYK